MKYRLQTKRGFSLFIAIVMTGVLLLIAFSVINISVKETQFSRSNRESQYALFAADAGIECAIYWDSIPATSAFDPLFNMPTGSGINCFGQAISTGSQNPIPGTSTASRIGGGGGNIVSVFGFSLHSASNPTAACVIVNVTKPLGGATSISAYGYNTCDMSDQRRVERGIEARY